MVHMKIAMVSTIEPYGHYTENLCKGLSSQPELTILLYIPRNEHAPALPKTILQKQCWSKGIGFMKDILLQVWKDRPDIVHLQHEFTMYGNVITALLFPVLVVLLRLMGARVITTLHAVVASYEINNEFIECFFIKKPWYINPFVCKLVFMYIYTITSAASNNIICHTELMRQHLIEEYAVLKNNVYTIAPIIPTHTIVPGKKEQYFLYFGYMVRRKGIEQVLHGFAKIIKKYPGFTLILAGGTIPGQESAVDELKAEIKKLHLEKQVHIKGFVSTEAELDKLYAKAYAVVIPARISIAASGPLYHARGYHKCVLASDIGNFTEEIEHMKNGILVSQNDWDTIMIKTIEHPKIVRQIEIGTHQIAKDHDGRTIGNIYSQLYASVIHG